MLTPLLPRDFRAAFSARSFSSSAFISSSLATHFLLMERRRRYSPSGSKARAVSGRTTGAPARHPDREDRDEQDDGHHDPEVEAPAAEAMGRSQGIGREHGPSA